MFDTAGGYEVNTAYGNEMAGTPVSPACAGDRRDTVAGDVIEIHKAIDKAIDALKGISQLMFGNEPTPESACAVQASADCMWTELKQMKDDARYLCELATRIQTRLS